MWCTRLQDRRELRHAEQALNEIKGRVEKAKQALEVAKVAAKALCPMTPEVKARFDSLPQSTVAELEQEMHNVEQQASAIFAVSDEEVRVFERRKAEIDSVEIDLAARTAALDQLIGAVNKKKTVWLQGDPDKNAVGADRLGLRLLVEKISESFQKYMSEIQCPNACVCLKDMNDSFEEYALEIKVTVRGSLLCDVFAVVVVVAGHEAVDMICAKGVVSIDRQGGGDAEPQIPLWRRTQCVDDDVSHCAATADTGAVSARGRDQPGYGPSQRAPHLGASCQRRLG